IAKGEVVSFIDADGATRAEELCKLVQELKKGVDGVIGSRWLPHSTILANQTFMRKLASRGLNLIVRLFFRLPFKDTQCGAKAFKKSAIDGVIKELHTTSFAFDIELLSHLKKRGYTVKEVPITWRDRGGSTLRMKTEIPKMALALLRLKILQ
ncbi:glycosyltransferase, partial [Chloroflexota bacterium]